MVPSHPRTANKLRTPSHVMTSVGSLTFLLAAWSCRVTRACPPGCRCGDGPADSPATWVTCEGRDHLPSVDAVHTLNMTRNSVAVIESNIVGGSVVVLDLSYNHVVRVENVALGTNALPNLTSLNLAHNHLTRIPTLSASLVTLTLDANRIGVIHLTEICHLSRLRTLNLADNRITKIEPANVYDEMANQGSKCQGLHDLEILSLQNNQITTVDRMLWVVMRGLQYLNLANNTISRIKFGSFKGLKFLKYLDLSGNQIHTIVPKTFKHLYDLKFLSLSSNLLTDVPEELTMVEWLDLSSNLITTISEKKQRSFYPQEVFLIGRNPLHCTCDLLWLKELYDNREYQLKFIDVDLERFVPTCATPQHLNGDTWDVLADAAFACINEPLFELTSTNSEEEDIPKLKLSDLTVNVAEIGETFLKIEWDSVNQKVVTNEKYVLLLNIHPFGKKNLQKSISIQAQVGMYTLKALCPNTAYILCMGIFAELSGPALFMSDNCLEIMTKEPDLPDVFLWDAIVQNPTIYLLLLTLSICLVWRWR